MGEGREKVGESLDRILVVLSAVLDGVQGRRLGLLVAHFPQPARLARVPVEVFRRLKHLRQPLLLKLIVVDSQGVEAVVSIAVVFDDHCSRIGCGFDDPEVLLCHLRLERELEGLLF